MRTIRIVAILAILVCAGWWIQGWSAKKTTIPPSGGLWFPVPILNDVPHFAQNDSRWGDDQLGETPGTLGEEGCAVASAAMVLSSYGADLNPGSLNRQLRENGGFTDRGWLYWEKASACPPVVAEHIYEDDASYFLIDWNLLCGNPVIVRLRYPSGITHFVVVVGKSGLDYFVRDPGSGYTRGIYRLSDFGSPIEALRFYRKLSSSADT